MTSKVDLTHCSVCLEVFITPRALPCLHTFCELCLHEYIRAVASSNRGSNLNEFDCPTCRQKVPAPSKDSWEKWAEQFVLNHMMVSLIDERKSKDSSLQDKLDERMKTLELKPKEVTLSETAENQELKSQPGTKLDEATDSHTQNSDYSPHFFPPPPTPHPDHWPPPPPPHHGPPPHHFLRGPPPHHRGHPHHRGPPPHHRGPPPHRFPLHHDPNSPNSEEQTPHWPPPHRRPHCHGPRLHGPPGRHGHRGHWRRH